jgi:hypothetical protein
MRGEAAYQNRLVKKLQRMFPDCFILKNDPSENQGVPDLLVLSGPYWAMLEVKLSPVANVQPNQRYYIDMFDQMSFAAFIYPEVEEQVLYDLQSAFGYTR